MTRRRSDKGFTLIELVLIMMLLVILAAAGAVSLQRYGEIKLNSAARRLASDMRFAQQLAMTRQVRHGVIFNLTVSGTPAANTYTVFQENSPSTDTPARNPARGGDMTVNYNTDARFQGVTITSPSFCVGAGCNETLEFNALGVATDSSGTQLTSGSVTLNYSGATSKTVTVIPATGKVTY